MGKSDMRRLSGFSLVELLIAMSILATISAIGVFSWNRFTANSNLRAATAEIQGDLMLLKQKAKSDTGTTYTITFDLDNNNYTMTGMPGTKTPSSFAPDISIPETDLSGVGPVTTGTSTITGQTRGTFLPTSGHIHLTNSRLSTATITYNVTGRAYVTYVMQ
jgi:prepilin-type N-terminal cleavage/methylation domain-containing protein